MLTFLKADPERNEVSEPRETWKGCPEAIFAFVITQYKRASYGYFYNRNASSRWRWLDETHQKSKTLKTPMTKGE
jgi:hypothetical protein